MKIDQNQFGYEIKTPTITVLLGNAASTIENLKRYYPDFSLVRLKQIHSDAVVQTEDPSLDYQVLADAHYTPKTHLGLCVITADCIPLFIYDPKKNIVAGIHAGWRGVASAIVPKTIQELSKAGSNPEDLQVVIGPHIQKDSFEVNFDVRDQILSSLGPLSGADRILLAEQKDSQKSLVDLNAVVKMQLQQQGVHAGNFFDLHIDTMISKDFHSYRRDKEKSGRQVSFICRTS